MDDVGSKKIETSASPENKKSERRNLLINFLLSDSRLPSSDS
jgi:hypothetical protein